ncbi:serine protease, S1-C subfamily, contains C-terminal PDZ domain [Geosporobacter subterraneus DSM 17957]|uniref:Serine protease, S1-C subfamily, contains C-terminal PDZ domain n=1 Tax=Geosporobacter subterraneus DSM 17957 TaxID=1121919 RepID=A0A1M6DLY6_9FIRM|nr:trypsin-like peptidase domain-containing protein [Geosporobacter subterraneus]SHI74163.1 serine protease, S1-C subfamily, contains C-terminal PDZ domain [Geosporobacter subterraneus DSM 17957]
MDYYDNKENIQEIQLLGEPEQPKSSSYYVQQQEPKPKKRRLHGGLITTALISALIGGMLSSYIFPVYVFGKLMPYPDNYFGKDVKQVIQVEPQQTEFLVSAVAKKAMPSVVGITTQTVRQDFFFGEIRDSGVGTGVIIDSRGYILTNAHVVDNGSASAVTVLFHDGSKKEAKVLWSDPALDLAVIKVDGVKVIPADLGDSEKLEVGEIAIAIGNPLGLQFERTVTSGIISGLGRRIDISRNETIEDLIQTDASINPGNSGGPLLNSKGEVIGINTAKIQSGEGLGFAIPINIAKPIVDQFIEKGTFSKVYMGIKGVDVEVFERSMGTELSVDKGVYVVEITKGSPAARGGLKSGDVIVALEDKEITTMSQLVRQMYRYRPGEQIEVKIVRDGENKTLKITLEQVPKN